MGRTPKNREKAYISNLGQKQAGQAVFDIAMYFSQATNARRERLCRL
jgi:hypothetical protein